MKLIKTGKNKKIQVIRKSTLKTNDSKIDFASQHTQTNKISLQGVLLAKAICLGLRGDLKGVSAEGL